MVIQALKERMDIHSDRMDLSEYNQMKILSLLLALCDDRGIDPSNIAGFNKPPPVPRSLSPHSVLNSPSIQSSPGLGMSSLALSDAPSDASNRSSVASNNSGTSTTLFIDILF